jgi:hypothetical protein
VPAGIFQARLYVHFDFGNAGSGAVGIVDYFGATRHEPASDVTSIIDGEKLIEIECDYLGTPLTGQLTKTKAFKLFRNGLAITSGVTWSRTLISGTVTTAISGTGTATFDISAITSDAVVRLQAVYLSTTRTLDVQIVKKLATPPSGGTGGSGNPGTTASDSSIAGTTSTTYGAANAGPLTVKAGTAGVVDLIAPLSYYRSTSTPGSTTAYGKWQWRVVAGAWADVTTEITATTDASTINEPPVMQDNGALTVNMQKTGLTASTDYEFQLLLRESNTPTGGINFSGTATATGS